LPVDAVRAHVLKLRSLGIRSRAIAVAAEVSASVVYGIASGRLPRVHRRTAERLLELDAVQVVL
jgi:hypothetical protein